MKFRSTGRVTQVGIVRPPHLSLMHMGKVSDGSAYDPSRRMEDEVLCRRIADMRELIVTAASDAGFDVRLSEHQLFDDASGRMLPMSRKRKKAIVSSDILVAIDPSASQWQMACSPMHPLQRTVIGATGNAMDEYYSLASTGRFPLVSRGEGQMRALPHVFMIRLPFNDDAMEELRTLHLAALTKALAYPQVSPVRTNMFDGDAAIVAAPEIMTTPEYRKHLVDQPSDGYA
jgi:hypothetical protein